nr:ABC transporter ATP-binding protein [Candidatus Sigynarchaeota archaeon]
MTEPNPSVPERRTSLRELASILRPQWKRSVESILLSIVQVSFHLQFPVILQTMVAQVIAHSETGLAAAFWWLVLAFVAEGLIMFFRLAYLNQYVANRIVYNLRLKVLGKILDHSYKFIDNEQSGDLVSVMTADINQVKQFLAFNIPYFTRNVVQLVGLVLIMLFINPRLLLFLTPILPFLAIAMFLYYKRIHPVTFDQRERLGDLTARLQENISGVHLVRAFANEDVEYTQFSSINKEYADDSKSAGKMASAYNPIIHMIIRLGWTSVLGIGGFLLLSGTVGTAMTLDQLFAFIPALNLLVEPVQFITWMAGEYGRIQAAYDRIRHVLELNIDIVEKKDAILLPSLRGDVSFKNVTFGYDPAHPVIKNVSFDVPAGKTVALLGATGSGKSTIINLLERFYDVTGGAVILDHMYDIRDVYLDSYRQQVGIVAQENFLFQQSVLDNLTHGLKEYQMDDVIEACKIAGILDFIESLPEKFSTIVGERGTTVSGGQKQRLTLARAILRKPRILILDDATSSVDVDTEYEILFNLKRIFSTCTTFIITQRLSTVRNADYIYMLDKGQIAEEGTHQQLIALKGLYASLYNTITYSPVKERRLE